MLVAVTTEDKKTREVEVVDSGSQCVGSVAHVNPETLQIRHQSGPGESYGVSRTEVSRWGRGGRAGTGKRMTGAEGGGCEPTAGEDTVRPDGLKLRARGVQEKGKPFHMGHRRAMLGGAKGVPPRRFRGQRGSSVLRHEPVSVLEKYEDDIGGVDRSHRPVTTDQPRVPQAQGWSWGSPRMG